MRWLVFLFLCLGWANLGLAAQQQEASQAQLKKLQQDIKQLQGWLNTAKGEHSQLETQLQKIEQEISQLVTRIAGIVSEAQELEVRLKNLNQQKAKLQTQLNQQSDYLKQQIRSAYSVGRQEYLKVLLNQQQPDKLARLLRYYDYINKQRTQQIEKYLGTAKQLEIVQGEIISRSRTLEGVRKSLQDRRQELLAEQHNRQKLIAQLSQEIKGKGNELTKLQADQKRLEELLAAVNEAIEKLPPPKDAQPFGQMRGRLPWPLRGRILTAFGSKQFNKVTSQGLVIQASEGAQVKAVHGGRVVFADWLRGFGFMLILDHGDGYMSLYGHNQTLLKQTGDWVQGGETLALAGSSGGQNRSGLYFAIRQQGKPQDPIGWVAKR